MTQAHVYIMASRSRVLYTGVTSDLRTRVYQHRHSLTPGFTSRYNVTRLVYYTEAAGLASAIAREKQIQKWRREKKLALIESMNPDWVDLSFDWFEAPP